MENKKIAAFFDIDGTIFRDSLMVAHFMKLQDFQIIDDSKWHTQVHLSREAYKKRRLDYDTYLESISSAYEESLKGISYSDVMFAARHVIQNRADEVYKFTRSRIEQHRKKGHMVIFISGSPDFLVRQMAKVWKADVYRGSTYVFSRGIFTGKIIPMWDSVSKQNAINELVNIYDIDMKHSYAYGDTNGDISMMFTPKGLEVISRHLRMLSRSISAFIPPAPMRPSPPAFETAEASWAVAILAIPPWMSGYLVPKSFDMSMVLWVICMPCS